MGSIPSNEALAIELVTLSYLLYDCIGLAEVVGPTFKEYDRFRDRAWCTSGAMLSAFGLPRTREGWRVLLANYRLDHPTLSEVQKAAYRRKEETRERANNNLELDESYPELVASSVREVTVDGKTYQYWSIR